MSNMNSTVRVLGKDLPGKKSVLYGIQYIKGIGHTLAKKFCDSVNIQENVKISDVADILPTKLMDFIATNQLLVEGDLTRDVKANIATQIRLRTYRGLRHSARLPVRGQRTKSNARVQKGTAGSTGITRNRKQKK